MATDRYITPSYRLAALVHSAAFIAISLFHAAVAPGPGTRFQPQVIGVVWLVFSIVGFRLALRHSPPFWRHTSMVFYAMSGLLGVASYLLFLATALLVRWAGQVVIELVAMFALLGSAVVSYALLRGAVRLDLLRHVPPPGFCRSCGYDLRAAGTGPCPECGDQAVAPGTAPRHAGSHVT